MRIERWAGLLLAVAPFMAGCGDFWQPPSGGGGGGGCTTNCTTLSSGNFYILNTGATPQIVGESIVSGTLTPISGSPWTVSSTPYSMAMAPNGNFLTVSTTSGVFSYPIASGKLGTAVAASGDLVAGAIGIDYSFSWLVEAAQNTGGVSLAAIPINSTTGANNGAELTQFYPVTGAALQSNRLVISRDNKYIFVSLGLGGTLVVPFNAGAASGTSPLGTTGTLIPTVNAAGSALSVAVDPNSTPHLFYVGETLANSAKNAGALRAFLYSSLGGTLAELSSSPISSGGLAPNYILPNGTGSIVYVANGAGASSAGNVTSFTVTGSGTAYTLASGSSATAGTQPAGLAEDGQSNFMLVVSSLGSPYLEGYTFDATTAGKLDSQISANTGSAPVAIVATQ